MFDYLIEFTNPQALVANSLAAGAVTATRGLQEFNPMEVLQRPQVRKSWLEINDDERKEAYEWSLRFYKPGISGHIARPNEKKEFQVKATNRMGVVEMGATQASAMVLDSYIEAGNDADHKLTWRPDRVFNSFFEVVGVMDHLIQPHKMSFLCYENNNENLVKWDDLGLRKARNEVTHLEAHLEATAEAKGGNPKVTATPRFRDTLHLHLVAKNGAYEETYTIKGPIEYLLWRNLPLPMF